MPSISWTPLSFRGQPDRSRFQVSRPKDFADVCDAWNHRVLPRLSREAPDIYASLASDCERIGTDTAPGSVTLVEDDGPWLNHHQTRFHLHVAVGKAAILPRLRQSGVSRLLCRLLNEELRRGHSASSNTLRECRFRSAVFHFNWHVTAIAPREK